MAIYPYRYIHINHNYQLIDNHAYGFCVSLGKLLNFSVFHLYTNKITLICTEKVTEINKDN